MRSVTLESVEGYLAGYDAATSGGTLHGFKEWLVLQLRAGTNLGWEALAEELIAAAKPEDDRNRDAALQLLDLVIEFWEDRDRSGGLRSIMFRYETWLREQSWYDPDSPIP